ncbi:MAG: AEC family transporter [Candidatus Rokubacteria bacterium]|nr:AEC family transporter [Candidatus Rokubacteria bacterium]
MTAPLAVAFVHVILPVLLIVAIGYALGRSRPVDLASITTLAVSVLVPGIVFDSLARATLPREVFGRLALHVILQLACIGVLATIIGRALRWDRASRGALLLATLFSNSGNMGLPLALFAYGPPGLSLAGGWFAVQAVSLHTFGVWIAARARAGGRAALRQLVRLPIFYAVLAGVVVNATGWPLPEPLAKVSQVLANGSLAVLLLLLGLHLAALRPRAEAVGASVATVVRLLVAPPVAWVTGRLIGLEGVPLAVAVIQASTPAAVTAALWAAEFDTRPGLVSATVVVSTLVSVATLTVLLALLGGGAPR